MRIKAIAEKYVLIILLASSLICGCSKPVSNLKAPSAKTLPFLSFSQSSATIDCQDFVEVTIGVTGPTARNPFRDVAITGNFKKEGTTASYAVEGFCDSGDGSIGIARFEGVDRFVLPRYADVGFDASNHLLRCWGGARRSTRGLRGRVCCSYDEKQEKNDGQSHESSRNRQNRTVGGNYSA